MARDEGEKNSLILATLSSTVVLFLVQQLSPTELLVARDENSSIAEAPFASLPYLNVDGGATVIGQHLAIGRYLGHAFGTEAYNFDPCNTSKRRTI